MLIILLVLLGLLIGFVVMIYNSLVAKAEAVENSKKQIDVQLDRRFKVFESLINIVKKTMDYEHTVLKEIVQLRSYAQSSKSKGDTKAQLDAEGKITKIANVIFESYPQLKSLENVYQLQEEVSSTENKLSFAKQAYNDAIEDYNVSKKSFFGSVVISIFSQKLNHNFDYWNLSAEKAQSYEDMNIKL